MDQDIILKTDRTGRVRTPRERQEQIVAEWKTSASCSMTSYRHIQTSGVSAMRFAEAIGVKYRNHLVPCKNPLAMSLAGAQGGSEKNPTVARKSFTPEAGICNAVPQPWRLSHDNQI